MLIAAPLRPSSSGTRSICAPNYFNSVSDGLIVTRTSLMRFSSPPGRAGLFKTAAAGHVETSGVDRGGLPSQVRLHFGEERRDAEGFHAFTPNIFGAASLFALPVFCNADSKEFKFP